MWKTREAFEEYLTAKIAAVAPKVGWDSPPQVQIFEVHNFSPVAGGEPDAEHTAVRSGVEPCASRNRLAQVTPTTERVRREDRSSIANIRS